MKYYFFEYVLPWLIFILIVFLIFNLMTGFVEFANELSKPLAPVMERF